MAAPHPVLDLNNLTDHPVVRIDSVEYELLTPALLPPLDAHRYSRYSARIVKLLEQKEELTADEEKELEDLPDRMCRLVLVASDEVHKKLTSLDRTRICVTFVHRPLVNPPAESGGPLPAIHSTGESSSLA